MPRSLAFLKTVLPWVFLGVLWYPYPAQALNCTQPPDQTTPACIGQWTAPFPSGPPGNETVVVHFNVLPNGKVLLWSRAGAAGGGENGSEPTLTWDPITDQYEVGPHIDDLFCSGHALLPDGKLLVAGGTLAGAAIASAYDGTTETWGAPVPMNNQRYYPSNLPLGTGEQLVIAGGAGKNAAGSKIENLVPQVWQLNGTFRNLTGARLELLEYPWLSLASDGRVFISGPQPASYWLTTGGAGTITKTTLTHPGWKANRIAGVPVTYRPGKVLITGGAGGVASKTTPSQTTNRCELIDLNQSPPHWIQVGNMAQPRVDHMAFVLPNGDVLVAGGTTGWSGYAPLGEVAGHDPDETKAVLTPELWNPGSPNQWRPMATMQVPRMYHSTGGLLPDGRVYVGGGGKKDGFTNQRTAEIFSPPYLFRGVRPTITGIVSQLGNKQVQYGESFTVTTTNTNIVRATLVRLPSTTHSLDFNQRFNELPLPVAVAGGYRLTAPANGNLCPPGHYYLHLINAAGVPSVATIIKVL